MTAMTRMEAVSALIQGRITPEEFLATFPPLPCARDIVRVRRPGHQDDGYYQLYPDGTWCYVADAEDKFHTLTIIGIADPDSLPTAEKNGPCILFQGRTYWMATGPNVWD